MKKRRLGLLVAILGIVVGLGFIGCGSSPSAASLSAEEQIAQADSYFNRNDFNRALPLYMEVAKRDDIQVELKAYATFRVGRIYDRNGDIPKSVEWYTEAATLGNMTAQLNLGNHYDRQKDYEKAFGWYLKSAEQGEPNAEYNVAVYYFNGYGVEKDPDLFAEWITKAYQHGSADAERVLRQLGILN